MSIYTGLYGKTYSIGELLTNDTGELFGSEGSIYSVNGNETVVAKIYHDDVLERDSGELEKKLKLMIEKNLSEQYKSIFTIAWPRDLLYKADNGKKRIFAGYIMRKVSAKYNLSDLTHNDPDDPDPDPYGLPGYVTWAEMIHAAYNLSFLVEYLHSNGIEIGDFNEQNFLFDEKTGGFSLVDCGAYGIFDDNHKPIFRSKYTMPKYVAPEKLAGIAVEDPRSADCFYLAIHIFHLLTKNSDPFSCKESSDGDPVVRLQNHILNGECLYVRTIPGMKLRKHAVQPGVLPDDILRGFNNTLNYTRDTIKESISKKILGKYLTDKARIKRCSMNIRHTYSAHLSTCPWCNPKSVSTASFEERNGANNNYKLSRKSRISKLTDAELLQLDVRSLSNDELKEYEECLIRMRQKLVERDIAAKNNSKKNTNIPQSATQARDADWKKDNKNQNKAKAPTTTKTKPKSANKKKEEDVLEGELAWNFPLLTITSVLSVLMFSVVYLDYRFNLGIVDNHAGIYAAIRMLALEITIGALFARVMFTFLSYTIQNPKSKTLTKENIIETIGLGIDLGLIIGYKCGLVPNESWSKELVLLCMVTVAITCLATEVICGTYIDFSPASIVPAIIAASLAWLLLLTTIHANTETLGRLMDKNTPKPYYYSIELDEKRNDEMNTQGTTPFYGTDCYETIVAEGGTEEEIKKQVAEVFFFRLEHDPVLAAVSLAYCDRYLGTNYTGKYYFEVSGDWAQNINEIAANFIKDEEKWNNGVYAFEEMLKESAAINIENSSIDTYKTIGMYSGDPPLVFNASFSSGLPDETLHILTFSVSGKGDPVVLSFDIGKGFTPILTS